MSFFPRRLTDPALTGGFSDYSDLIAWGKPFPAIPCLPSLALRTVGSVGLARGRAGTTRVAHGAVPMPWPGLQNKPGWMNTARGCAPTCCLPWGAPGRPDPLAHPFFLGPEARAGWAARAARRVRGVREVFGCHPSLPVTSGLSLGDFQHCSFHFSAAGEAAYGGLKGINDA